MICTGGKFFRILLHNERTSAEKSAITSNTFLGGDEMQLAAYLNTWGTNDTRSGDRGGGSDAKYYYH